MNESKESGTSGISLFFKIAVRVCVMFSLSIVAAIAYCRWISSEKLFSMEWTRQRISLALDFFDHLPKKDKKIIAFIGASDVEFGIDPITIDDGFERSGVATDSYNLGIRNLDPKLLRIFVHRLNLSLETQRRKLDLAVIRFSPLRATRVYVRGIGKTRSFRHLESEESAIYTGRMLWDAFLQKPDFAVKLAWTKYVFGGISSASVKGATSDLLYDFFRSSSPSTVVEREMATLIEHLWTSEIFNNGPAWNLARRGHFYFDYPRSRAEFDPLVAHFQKPALEQMLIKRQDATAGAVDMIMDDDMVNDFILAVREMKAQAREVVVYYQPELVVLPKSRAVLDRLDQTLQKIRDQAAVPLIAYKREEFRRSDFFDHVHLSSEGQSKLAALLVRDLTDRLRASVGGSDLRK